MNRAATIQLATLASDELVRCAGKLSEKGLYVVSPWDVVVLCDLRGKSRVGLALPRLSTIRLSVDYFEALGDRYRSTIAHEYAHIVTRKYEKHYGLRRSPSHGRRWQGVMRALGYEPERTLTEDERRAAEGVRYARKARKFAYACLQGHVVEVGIQRHRKMQEGATYLCCVEGCRTLPNASRRIAFLKEA